MNILFISSVSLLRIKFIVIAFLCVFRQSQAVIITFVGNKRYKCTFLRDKIYKKVLNFKEKQKCNMCDKLISYHSIFSFY